MKSLSFQTAIQKDEAKLSSFVQFDNEMASQYYLFRPGFFYRLKVGAGGLRAKISEFIQGETLYRDNTI